MPGPQKIVRFLFCRVSLDPIQYNFCFQHPSKVKPSTACTAVPASPEKMALLSARVSSNELLATSHVTHCDDRAWSTKHLAATNNLEMLQRGWIKLFRGGEEIWVWDNETFLINSHLHSQTQYAKPERWAHLGMLKTQLWAFESWREVNSSRIQA